MNEAEYDKIAEKYSRSNVERNDRSCILVPTAKHYLGDIRGAKVLDLACGDGFFSRRIAEWGAAKVVGVDLSREMIAIASEEEKKRGQGIEYLVGDAATVKLPEKFDVVFAAFLLHYARSTQELGAMCANIAAHLAPAGRFLSFNENPFAPLHSGIKYDVEARPVEPLRDGSRVRRVHFKSGREDFSFTHFHYEPRSYETALREAGLSQIRWLSFIAPAEVVTRFPPGYWDDYLSGFSIATLSGGR